jgi:hypothetical protein
MVEDEIKDKFYNNELVKKVIPGLQEEIIKGKLLPTAAVKKLLQIFNS